jgi:hypothetical protein
LCHFVCLAIQAVLISARISSGIAATELTLLPYRQFQIGLRILLYPIDSRCHPMIFLNCFFVEKTVSSAVTANPLGILTPIDLIDCIVHQAHFLPPT